MFPIWFQILFYTIFYGLGIPFLAWAFVDTIKGMKEAMSREEDFEEEEWN